MFVAYTAVLELNTILAAFSCRLIHLLFTPTCRAGTRGNAVNAVSRRDDISTVTPAGRRGVRSRVPAPVRHAATFALKHVPTHIASAALCVRPGTHAAPTATAAGYCG